MTTKICKPFLALAMLWASVSVWAQEPYFLQTFDDTGLVSSEQAQTEFAANVESLDRKSVV